MNCNYIFNNINGYSLDKEQRIAIITDECANLIVAGAGSGKSLTMIGKIHYLIEIMKIKPSEILCITFTKDAANNLEKNINNNSNYNIKVYTFHKLSLEILEGKQYKIFNKSLLEYIVDEYFLCAMYDKNTKSKIKKIMNMVDTPYKVLLKSNEINDLKALIVTFINLFKGNNYEFKEFLKMKKYKELISIIIDIYYLYNEELKSTNSIDFNDMISLATKQVKTNFIKMYKYIIVDEYQDTSYNRYLLLKEIINKTGAKIICVGDDYQSIYRFNGCNLNIFLNYKKYFGYSKILKINNTYRNSQELISVAGSFIMKNKNQLYKRLKSSKKFERPIKIVLDSNLDRILDIIIKKYEDILILGRNNLDIKKYFKIIINDFILYKGKNIRYLTIHASKGLESDCVIVLNLIDNIFGLPNKKTDNKILKYVNNNIDIYPFEEERRLFYVALTRTKNEVYLITNSSNKSIFIKELEKEYNKYIEYI